MLYGEVHPYGYFRFVNFGHPPPLVFSAEYRKFVELDKDRMVQFLPLGLQIPLIIRIVSGTSQCSFGPGRPTRPILPKLP